MLEVLVRLCKIDAKNILNSPLEQKSKSFYPKKSFFLFEIYLEEMEVNC